MAIPKSNLADLNQEVHTALTLLSQDEADAIIIEQTPEYQTLQKGMQALLAMQFAFVKGAGLKQTPAVLKVMSQTLQMALVMIHTAFALGVRLGTRRAISGEGLMAITDAFVKATTRVAPTTDGE